MLISPQGRRGFMLGFLTCFAGLAFAYYLEYFQDLAPCPLCILQRVAMLFTGLGCLLAALWNAQGLKRWLSALPALAGAGAGLAIAGRHVWLQGLPPDQVPACGPPLDYLLDIMPLTEAIAFLLKGEGSCAVIDAQFLGLSLPGWTLLVFAALAIWTILCAIASDESQARTE